MIPFRYSKEPRGESVAVCTSYAVEDIRISSYIISTDSAMEMAIKAKFPLQCAPVG